MEETRASLIQGWVDERKKNNEEPYKVMFLVTVPKLVEDLEEQEAIKKVRALFDKYSVEAYVVDTKLGAFNLDRSWLETMTTTDCYIEYVGVYPINWDIEDVVELERMENEGEIILYVYYLKDGEYVPNN